MLQPSPPRYSSISPLVRYNEDDPSQSRVIINETNKNIKVLNFTLFVGC